MSQPKTPRRKPSPDAAAPPEVLTLSWRLAELPSSQHRAGLAGLVLMARYWQRLPERRGRVEVEVSALEASLVIDREGMAALFDLIFAATWEESAESAIRQKGRGDDKTPVEPKREEVRENTDKKGKVTKKKFFIYDVVVPGGAWLVEVEPGGNPQGPWVRMWRNFVWSILRGIPATRPPFEHRANGVATTDGHEAFDELSSQGHAGTELPSSYYLGAMAASAEGVAFRDRVSDRFLLNFWPHVAQLFVPQAYNSKDQRWELGDGFAVAVPDVVRLDDFCEDFVSILKTRESRMMGYRPADAVIDTPSEAALRVSARLRERVQSRLSGQAVVDLVQGYDILHVAKEGNNVRILSNGRVHPTSSMIDVYAHYRKTLFDPYFRRTVIENLLAGNRWTQGFAALLSTQASDYFLSRKKQNTTSWFAHDAKRMFHHIRKEEKTMAQDGDRTPHTLEDIVYDMVQRYVGRRASQRTGLEWKEAEASSEGRQKYGEARERFARDAFLAVRSRTGGDFIEYFSNTLCAHGQYLPRDRFLSVTRALREQTDEVRTLTLLALSAATYVVSEKKEATA